MAKEKNAEVRPVNRKGWFKPYIASTWQREVIIQEPLN